MSASHLTPRERWAEFYHEIRLYLRNYLRRVDEMTWDRAPGDRAFALLRRLPPFTLTRTIG